MEKNEEQIFYLFYPELSRSALCYIRLHYQSELSLP